MARTPEHAPQIPHIPVPDLKGGLRLVQKHWPQIGGATLTLAGLGLGWQMLTGSDRGPSTIPAEANKAADTIKPPTLPDQAPAVSVNIPPPPDLAKIDKQANVDAAIKNGVLEVKEGNFERYFTPVTPVEAAKLLEEKGNSGFLLNFDPTKSPNLIILTLNIPIPNGPVAHATGAKNVGAGSIVYSSEPGIATIRSGNSGEDLIYSLKVQSGNRLTGASFQRTGSQPLIPTDQEVPVDIGTPLASINGVGPLSRFSEAQVFTGFGVNVRQANQGALNQLARAADGGIAYLPQP